MFLNASVILAVLIWFSIAWSGWRNRNSIKDPPSAPMDFFEFNEEFLHVRVEGLAWRVLVSVIVFPIFATGVLSLLVLIPVIVVGYVLGFIALFTLGRPGLDPVAQTILQFGHYFRAIFLDNWLQ